MKMRRLIAFLFPERCPFCMRAIESDEIACRECARKYIEGRFPIIKGAGGIANVASFEYGGKVRKGIINFKFHSKPQFARQFAAIMKEDIARYHEGVSFDIITYVPLHPADKKVRGYNQSELLARELSRELDIPLCAALTKVKRTRKQHHLKISERRRNLKNAFRISEGVDIRGKNILLIDDIVTSGATISECAATLSKEHPARICSATIAHAGEHIRTLPTL